MAGADGPIKTFPLRGIKDSPPYLHDGRLLTLEDTVEFFNLVLETKLTARGEGGPGGVPAGALRVPASGAGARPPPVFLKDSSAGNGAGPAAVEWNPRKSMKSTRAIGLAVLSVLLLLAGPLQAKPRRRSSPAAASGAWNRRSRSCPVWSRYLGLHRRHRSRTRPTSRSRPAAPGTPRRSRSSTTRRRSRYEKLARHLLAQHRPAHGATRQFCDHGEQYRSAIFYARRAQRRLAEESKKKVEQTAFKARRSSPRSSPASAVLSGRGVSPGLLQEESRSVTVSTGRAAGATPGSRSSGAPTPAAREEKTMIAALAAGRARARPGRPDSRAGERMESDDLRQAHGRRAQEAAQRRSSTR